ncbi:class F sortase [Streptomyces sp. RB6PN23]|uniref:Class F sortase n=2 Tax=Streptomyces TaxID=1883 RepID=A0ABT5ZFF1_9ACTN|nr:class F sortase [Streptomyces sp. RPT161]MDF3288309.1 class F sortase [Streptomyces silvisoli]
MHDGSQSSQPPAPKASDGLPPGRHGAVSSTPTVPPMPNSAPRRVRIPAIHVDAPLMNLGIGADHELQVPPDSDRNLAGWYTGSAQPGALGAAVLAGHVDTMAGPAVFYNLGSLHKGNTVEVARADHRTAVFTIYGIEVYAKEGFPTEKVYAGTPAPEIRLITCGGGFSRKTHSYTGNVVVYARLTGTR